MSAHLFLNIYGQAMIAPVATESFLLPFLTVALLHFLAVVSPGPDFAILIKTALTQSRKTAIFTAAGIALGVSIHATYCILGLAIVIAKSVILFNVFKYLGAAYFIYIGIQGLLNKTVANKANITLTTGAEASSNIVAMKKGFLCNVLNPKATLFFLGLFTLVVNPDTPLFIQGLYGVEMIFITFLWFSFLAIVITHPHIKTRLVRIQHYITKFMGGLLVLFGIKLAILEFK